MTTLRFQTGGRHQKIRPPFGPILWVKAAEETFVANPACALAHQVSIYTAVPGNRLWKGNHSERNIVTDLNLTLWKSKKIKTHKRLK